MSDIELEDDFDNEDDGILIAFTAIINPTEEIVEDVDEEEELVESKYSKPCITRRDCHYIASPIVYWGKGSTVG